MKQSKLTAAARLLGSKGGKRRAARYSQQQLREWAALGGKDGGRPKGSKDRKPRKQRTKKGGKA